MFLILLLIYNYFFKKCHFLNFELKEKKQADLCVLVRQRETSSVLRLSSNFNAARYLQFDVREVGFKPSNLKAKRPHKLN